MTSAEIRFDDGAGYERFMGVWSQAVGTAFLDWLNAPAGLRWLDVGCGNGAFSELVIDRCAPIALSGIDPSEAQLAHARMRISADRAEFRRGDAMALPYDDDSFDVAVMPLVIFFVSDPALGVCEMARVARPGGMVTAYAWDMPGGGFPYHIVNSELRERGVEVPKAPSVDASRLDRMHELWTDAGLTDIETRVFTAERTFANFDDYWETLVAGPAFGTLLGKLSTDDRQQFQARLCKHLNVRDGAQPITTSARANAVKGRNQAA